MEFAPSAICKQGSHCQGLRENNRYDLHTSSNHKSWNFHNKQIRVYHVRFRAWFPQFAVRTRSLNYNNTCNVNPWPKGFIYLIRKNHCKRKITNPPLCKICPNYSQHLQWHDVVPDAERADVVLCRRRRQSTVADALPIRVAWRLCTRKEGWVSKSLPSCCAVAVVLWAGSFPPRAWPHVKLGETTTPTKVLLSAHADARVAYVTIAT